MDIVSREKRALMMSGIKGKNTKPELIVRKYLHACGLRYRLHDKRLAGSPDLVFTRHNLVVFVHGCFWHRHRDCRYATTPGARQEFWVSKLEKNRTRDEASQRALLMQGWRVAVVWECALRRSSETTLAALHDFVLSDRSFHEFTSAQDPSAE